MYGPKGVGGLYVRRRPRVRLEAQINGGGQERGLRSGTLPTPLVVGFGAACELAGEEMEADHAWVTHLSEVRPAPSRLLPSSCQGLSGDLRVCNAQRLYDGITSQLEEVKVNGCPDQRYPGNTNISFAWIEGESLLMAMKKVAVSSVSYLMRDRNPFFGGRGGGGLHRICARVLEVALTAGLCTWQGSACTSASLEPSYVLRALGVEDDLVREPTPRRPFRGCDSHLMRECCWVCAGALVDPVRLRPVHDRGGGGLGGGAHRDPRPTAARHVAALRDAPGRHRYQLHPVVAALKSARPGLVVERGWQWVLA
eukprot:COSAG04_NODE_619_length_11882_cov_18.845880_6_plen_311_part_00